MSDPVKTEDIEDVLSSIRRLVSEEPRPRPMPAAAPAPASAGQPGKLVLTPAFRVVDAAAAEPTAPESVDGAEHGAEASGAAAADPWDDISLEERIAELEAAVAEADEDWEPDGSEIDLDEVPLERLRARRGPTEDDAQDGRPEAADDGDTVLDEEALRDLVAALVRQELQGALGARITRNVRKLVRQEINRALASRDLE
ncbi:hypothetical protein [Actibacterium sp. MT2.3-13A]|uniref:hypothetical protein n=1 Tax=Actibacterium sp. MT2.3-13A TaxID=2828332 RepID=UPI001BA78F60|nr:hypothetical protein [Actibacterium sp. MT2.3-13A]